MIERLKRHHASFKNAINGIFWVVSSEANFQIHLTIGVFTLLAGILLSLDKVEMIILIFTIILGLAAEMINTAIEEVTDLVKKEWSKEAKIAKDVSAGMMLLVSIGSAVIGIYILLPKLIELTF